jgi:hypothetical protein
VTDLQAQAERHNLLPGTSAYTLWRVTVTVTTILSIAVGLSIGYVQYKFGEADSLTSASSTLLFVPLGFDVAVSAILFTFAIRRAKAETIAGYTTRTSGYTAYDQVDPRSGLVLRRAGSAVLTVPKRNEEVGAPGTLPAERLRFSNDQSMQRRKLLVWIAGPIMLLVILAGSWGQAGGGRDGSILLGLALGSVVLIVVVTFVSVAVYMGSYLKTASQDNSGSFVFLSRNTPELRAACLRLGLNLPKGKYFGVSASNAGLEIWPRKTALGPASVLPWNLVTRVQPGRLIVQNGQSNVPAATLHVFATVDGEQLDFPFPVFGPRGMAFANVTDANAVLDAVSQYARIA